MKKYLLFLFLAFIACKNSIEENCFQNEDDKIFEPYIEEPPFSVNQILDEKPEYLEIKNLQKFRSFKKDSIEDTSLAVMPPAAPLPVPSVLIPEVDHLRELLQTWQSGLGSLLPAQNIETINCIDQAIQTLTHALNGKDKA